MCNVINSRVPKRSRPLENDECAHVWPINNLGTKRPFFTTLTNIAELNRHQSPFKRVCKETGDNGRELLAQAKQMCSSLLGHNNSVSDPTTPHSTPQMCSQSEENLMTFQQPVPLLYEAVSTLNAGVGESVATACDFFNLGEQGRQFVAMPAVPLMARNKATTATHPLTPTIPRVEPIHKEMPSCERDLHIRSMPRRDSIQDKAPWGVIFGTEPTDKGIGSMHALAPRGSWFCEWFAHTSSGFLVFMSLLISISVAYWPEIGRELFDSVIYFGCWAFGIYAMAIVLVMSYMCIPYTHHSGQALVT